tara:strand:- start:1384 stop:2922 length:1539 start_codon:yes stop_codon:yes gene_type:complete
MFSFFKNKFELHPFLFGIFPIFFIFVANIHLVQIEDLVTPLCYIISLIVIFTIILQIILKNKRKTAFILTIGLLLFFSYGHFYDIVEENIYNFSNKILLSIFLIVFVVITIYFLKTKRILDNATKISNVIASTIIIISFVSLGTYYLDDQSQFSSNNFVNVSEIEHNELENFEQYRPDIYYIVLDAYTGQESLEKNFGFNNDKFYNFLTENGFYIAKNSHSNYQHSYQSITSSLMMDYINEIDEFDLQKRTDLAYQISDENNLMKKFKSKGYVIVNINSAWGMTRSFSVADLNLCTDKTGITSSELFSMTINKTILQPIFVRLFEDDRRELVLCHFETIQNANKITSEPMFLFSHITIPHAPYVFGPNGEEIVPESLQLGYEDDPDLEGYIGQLQFTNKMIKQTIEKILLEYDEPPIIVIHSDHGSGEFQKDIYKQTDESMQERFSNLVTILVPDAKNNIFYDTITPVNIFRIILNEKFEEEFSILEDRMYSYDYEPPWKFVDVTEVVMKRT